MASSPDVRPTDNPRKSRGVLQQPQLNRMRLHQVEPDVNPGKLTRGAERRKFTLAHGDGTRAIAALDLDDAVSAGLDRGASDEIGLRKPSMRQAVVLEESSD